MKPIEIIIIAGACILLLVLKGIYDKYAVLKRMKRSVRSGYGQLPPNHYDADRYKHISHYFEHKAHIGDVIDEITWNDLDMELLFMTINNTQSAMGEEYLYAMLHEPLYSKDAIDERGAKIHLFETNQTLRESLTLKFKKIGKMRRLSVFQYVDLLMDAKPHNPWLDIAMLVGLFVFIGLSIFVAPDFLIGVIGIIVINMVTYFSYKNKMYFSSFGQVSAMINQFRDISKETAPEIDESLKELETYAKPLIRMGRFSWLFKEGKDIGGTLVDVFMDYVKMVTHVDLIFFDYALASYQKRQDDLRKMMAIVGELDALIAVASYRTFKEKYTVPVIDTTKAPFIDAVNLYHPLLEHPVPATFETTKPMLLTGSNASGKSTFLKSVAINALFAQTICTVLAERYTASAFRIYSSMALKDDIMGGESYFIVEIKSLKRIMEKAGEAIPMLCFVDEVLRGTNTVERIAASSRILAELGDPKMKTLSFAATHDIELTRILENIYNNYHFQEEIKGQEVMFDYELRSGRAVSRNAIKLLGMIGFAPDVIQKAEEAGKDFEETGTWAKID